MLCFPDCDEFLEGYGGEIKLDGHQHLINTYVDCIWIIGRFPHMARTFDRIYLKIEEFHMKGVGLRLEIREGASSTSDRLLLLFDSQTRDQVEHKQPRHGFATTSSSPAFYIRLRGYLMGSAAHKYIFQEQMVHSPTPEVTPAAENEVVPNHDDVTGELKDEEGVSLASPSGVDQPTTSGASPKLQRKDDESWV
ncbi:hypothetical protein GCK32_018297 [Trichostrongylus colubriformis]|uniref:CUB domain-containing protein n=1 Tax=Trichostrongylus colubriformis TaxID=6319 RepID=A0AAN8IBN4_TRICO